MSGYTPYYSGGWQSGEQGGTPITPAALNNMEAGIGAALTSEDVVPGESQVTTPNTNYVSANESAYVENGNIVMLSIAFTLNTALQSNDYVLTNLPISKRNVWVSVTGEDNKAYRLRISGNQLERYYGSSLPAQGYNGNVMYFKA